MAKLKRKSYFLVGVDVVEIYATRGLHVVLELLKEGKISKDRDFLIIEWEGNTSQLEDVLDMITQGHYINLHPDEHLAIQIARMNIKWDLDYNSL